MKTLIAVASLSLAAACATSKPTRLEPCTVTGVSAATRCGSVSVPESRTVRGKREIPIHVSVVPATGSARKADPVVILGGGPGQSGSLIAPVILPELAEVNQSRDLVFVDQRGTGQSNPLNCPDGFQLLDGATPSQTSACIEELSRFADLAQYTTDAAADDLRDLISSFGYERINLVAASYGTRPALVFAQRYPELVRTMTLRALVSDNFNILHHGTMNLALQLERLFRDCAADAACHRAYPTLRDDFFKLRRGLAADPVQLKDVTFTPFLFDQMAYALMLSAPTRQQLPFLITRAASGDFTTIGALAVQIRSALYGTLPVGMYLSIVCTEDAPRITAADRAEMTRALPGFAISIAETCQQWPRGRLARELASPAPIDAPTLVISGGLDPATPPAAAEKGLPNLRRSKHIVVPTASHGPMFPGCVRDLVARFIATGQMTTDDACANEVPLPPFAVPPPSAR